MKKHDELKLKWGELVQKREAGYAFDCEQLSPGKFCVHISDTGGESMACYSSLELTGFFDSPIDTLAYFRFVEIPRILDWDTDTHNEPFPDVADAFLEKYEEGQRTKTDHLLGLLDRSLFAGVVSTKELSVIRSEFHSAFSDTNPEVQILSWGNLSETLSSDYFVEKFEEEIEEENEEGERPYTYLKELLDSSRFDEGDGNHLAVARDFLERQMSA